MFQVIPPFSWDNPVFAMHYHPKRLVKNTEVEGLDAPVSRIFDWRRARKRCIAKSSITVSIILPASAQTGRTVNPTGLSYVRRLPIGPR